MTSIRPFEERQLPVAGGATINMAEWPGSKGPLLCIHGLTSSSRAFAGLATELDDYRIVAVDCRGRGHSSKDGPYGLTQHAEDIASVIATVDIERATVVGHSMGAYIAGALHDTHRERVEQLVFVDGGYLFEYPAELDPDTLLNTLLAPFLEKLRRSWSSVDEYVRYYETTPVYAGGVDAYGRVHMAFDLTGQPPELTARIAPDCIAPDWRDLLDRPAVAKRLEQIRVPLLLVRAPGGLTGQGDEVIPDAIRDMIVEMVPQTHVVDVPGTNHHTVMLSEPGARAVAAAIRAL